MPDPSKGYHEGTSAMLAKFSNLAYKQPPVFQKFCQDSHPDFKQYFFENKETDTQLYVHVSSDDIIVSFRGTESITDVTIDLHIDKVETEKGYIHRGFLEAFQSIWNKKHVVSLIIAPNGWIISKEKMTLSNFLLKQSMKVNRHGFTHDSEGKAYGTKNIWITGHSLGGALATLALGEISERLKPYCAAYTFGAPPVGDSKYATYLDDNFKDQLFRIVNNNDSVPRSLFCCCYVHAGTEALFPSSSSSVLINPSFSESFIQSISGILKGVFSFSLCGNRNTLCDPLSDHLSDQYVAETELSLSKDPSYPIASRSSASNNEQSIFKTGLFSQPPRDIGREEARSIKLFI